MNKINKKQRDRARRGPSLEQDLADQRRKDELKANAKKQGSIPSGRLAALVAHLDNKERRR